MPIQYESGSSGAFGNDRKVTKQVLTSAPQFNVSFIATYATAGEITGMKAAAGSMAFCQADNKIYIFNGTAWVKSAALS